MSGFRLHRLYVTPSTNDEVKRAAEAGEPEGYAVQALRQTAGRGRHGRVWESPEGNLYCSVLLRPASDACQLGFYSFVAALAVYDTVHGLLPDTKPALKWPNDVLIDGKKVCGILIEAGDGYLVIGIGLNVAHGPDNPLYPTQSLVQAGLKDTSLDKIVEALMARLWHWYGVLKNDGFAPIRAAWLAKALTGPVSVKLPHETVNGAFAGLGADGSLRLRLASGAERSIASGDVFPVKA